MHQGVIGEVAELAKLAQLDKRIVKAPQEPPHIYYTAEDGERGITLVKQVATPPAERSIATDISTLVDWTKATAGSEVWYSRKGVVGSPSPERPDSGRCSLPLAPFGGDLLASVRKINLQKAKNDDCQIRELEMKFGPVVEDGRAVIKLSTMGV